MQYRQKLMLHLSVTVAFMWVTIQKRFFYMGGIIGYNSESEHRIHNTCFDDQCVPNVVFARAVKR